MAVSQHWYLVAHNCRSVGEYQHPVYFTSNFEALKSEFPQLVETDKRVSQFDLTPGLELMEIASCPLGNNSQYVLYAIPGEWIKKPCTDLYVVYHLDAKMIESTGTISGLIYQSSFCYLNSDLTTIQKRWPDYRGDSLWYHQSDDHGYLIHHLTDDF